MSVYRNTRVVVVVFVFVVRSRNETSAVWKAVVIFRTGEEGRKVLLASAACPYTAGRVGSFFISRFGSYTSGGKKQIKLYASVPA